jgi:hypothetical protein
LGYPGILKVAACLFRSPTYHSSVVLAQLMFLRMRNNLELLRSLQICERLCVPLIAFVCFFSLWNCGTATADEIILRDLTVIKNVRVVSLDVTGVHLSDGRELTWDQIDSGKITSSDQLQESFDSKLADLSLPLYRIVTRLQGKEYQSLAEPAEKLYPLFVGKTGDTARMVNLAVLRSRLYLAEREKAVDAYLRCLEETRHDGGDITQIAGEPVLLIHSKTGLCSQLSPIWFDEKAAKAALPYVLRAIADMEKPYPAAARAYYANLASSAGDFDRAEFILEGFNRDSRDEKELAQICQAYLELHRGDEPNMLKKMFYWQSFLPLHQPLAIWLYGTWQLDQQQSSDEAARAMALLLQIPASFADQDPDLAAAALWVCREQFIEDNPAKAERLKQEILGKYPKTYFGRKAARLESDASPTADNVGG